MPLGFLLQYSVEVKQDKLLSPTESYFLVLLMNIYDAASEQNLSCSMTQDSCEPYLTEKTC